MNPSFSLQSEQFGFVNSLLYDPYGLKSQASVFAATAHENIHAHSFNKSAILHASPWNPAADAILCPRDFVKMILMCEQDAFAKQAWFSSLAKDNRDVALKSDRAPVNARWFATMRKAQGTLQGALREAAAESMNTQRNDDKHGNLFTYEDYYRDWALNTYRSALASRAGCKDAVPAVPVRMDSADMVTIGQSFGPNPFDDGNGGLHSDFSALPVFTEEEEKLIADLNALLDISDDSALPTFREQMAATGQTPESFLNKSLTQGVRQVQPRTPPNLTVVPVESSPLPA